MSVVDLSSLGWGVFVAVVAGLVIAAVTALGRWLYGRITAPKKGESGPKLGVPKVFPRIMDVSGAQVSRESVFAIMVIMTTGGLLFATAWVLLLGSFVGAAMGWISAQFPFVQVNVSAITIEVAGIILLNWGSRRTRTTPGMEEVLLWQRAWNGWKPAKTRGAKLTDLDSDER